MFDYYHYFAEKGNHPDDQKILALETNIDLEKLKCQKESILNEIIKAAPKPIGLRIIIDDVVILEYLDSSFDETSERWLCRKEKVVKETKHSSYYIFLNNMKTHQYDYMITDESYAICGGGFPLYEDDELRGTMAVTGCRPHEDHQLIIDALKKELLL